MSPRGDILNFKLYSLRKIKGTLGDQSLYSKMKSLTLKEFLDSCVRGSPIEGPVDTLEVHHWKCSWWSAHVHSHALAYVCQRLQVRRLCFMRAKLGSPDEIEEFRENLAKHTQPSAWGPFLSHLKMIEVQYVCYVPKMWTIIQDSNVWSLTWHLVMENATRERILDYADQALEVMSEHSLDRNRRLRELRFGVPWMPEPIHYDPVKGPFTQIWFGKSILTTLERNQNRLKKCQKAVVVFLGLSRRRGYVQNRDVLGVVARILWTTRSLDWWAV